MMARTSTFGRVVAPHRALLRTVSSHHRGIQIQRNPVDGDLIKHPSIQHVHHRFIGALAKLVEQPHHRFEVRHTLKAKQAL